MTGAAEGGKRAESPLKWPCRPQRFSGIRSIAPIVDRPLAYLAGSNLQAEATRVEAAELVRALLDQITLVPEAGVCRLCCSGTSRRC